MRKKQPQIVRQRKGRAELERLLADGNTAQKIAKRASIVLMSADGHGVMAIMREAGVSKTTVWRWQEYFVEAGEQPTAPRSPEDRWQVAVTRPKAIIRTFTNNLSRVSTIGAP